jgi:hypothetical protein
VLGMSSIIDKEIYKQIDEERIKEALLRGNRNEAFVLFKYSVLTKEEFDRLQQRYTYHGVFEKQMREYLKEKDKERIKKAIKEGQYEAAEYLFKYSDLTEKEFEELKRGISK